MRQIYRKIIYSMGLNKFLEIERESHKTLKKKGQKPLKVDDNKLEEIIERNRKYNIFKKYFNNNYFIIVAVLIQSIIIINLSYQTKSRNIFDNHIFRNSKITLKVKGIGENRIISGSFKNYLEGIYINSNKQDIINNKYFFNESENFVEICFKDNINLNKLSKMFFNCINIIEIDLSLFNTSSAKETEEMFYGCSSLRHLDLSNFDSSLVTSM